MSTKPQELIRRLPTILRRVCEITRCCDFDDTNDRRLRDFFRYFEANAALFATSFEQSCDGEAPADLFIDAEGLLGLLEGLLDVSGLPSTEPEPSTDPWSADLRRHYPKVSRLCNSWRGATSDEAALSEFRSCFGSGRTLLDNFIHFLKQLVGKTTDSIPAEQPSQAVLNLRWKPLHLPSFAVGAAVESIFHALKGANSCKCDTVHTCSARLALSTYQKCGPRVGVIVDVLLCPNESFDLYAPSWQPAQVIVENIGAPVTSLCDELRIAKRVLRSTINFRVHQDRAWQLSRLNPSRDRGYLRLCFTEPVYLSTIIIENGVSLTDKVKRVLAVLLSYSVMRLSGSQWLRQRWDKRSIMFFTRAPTNGLPLMPYIELQLESTSQPDAATEDLPHHPYANLVSLATVLLEIFMAEPIESLALRYGVEPPQVEDTAEMNLFVYDIYKACQQLLLTNYRTAIEKCLDLNFAVGGDGSNLDEQGLMEKIYTEIVFNLEDELSRGFGNDKELQDIDEFAQNHDLKNWGHKIGHPGNQAGPSSTQESIHPQPISSKSKSPNRKVHFADAEPNNSFVMVTRTSPKHPDRLNEHSPPPNVLAQHRMPVHGQESCESSKRSRAASYCCCFDSATLDTPDQPDGTPPGEHWFAWLEDTHEFMAAGRKEQTRKEKKSAVKIAVLDTGLDMTHPQMQGFFKNHQKDDCFDFVDDTSDMKDTNGHGTHVTHLLLRTAPFAKIYPARVFKDTCADEQTARLVGKAIQHAVDTWKVDIISLSFAFEDEDIDIKKAIEHATSQKILVFAAASNNNGNSKHPIGYPARVREHVICINSSSSQNHKSDFSPFGTEWRRNFSVVGQNLRAAWAPTRSFRVLSGTSCATPIGAGIAALIIEYSRQKASPRIVRAHELSSIAGMNQVLFECMTEKRKGSEYNYLKPWTLFSMESDAENVSRRIDQALSEVND